MRLFLAQSLWSDFQKSFLDKDRWLMYLDGLKMTLLLALVGTVVGIILGLLVALIKYSYSTRKKNKPWLTLLNWLANLYTTVIRGTPVVVQLLILFSLSFMPNGVLASFIGFGVNSGAYVAEVFRSGINSIDMGQMEAGRSLGLSSRATMRYIILPQAIKNILPALFNEFIALVKETSVAGYIAVNDLTKVADRIKGITFVNLPLYIVALMYLCIVYLLTLIQKRIEVRYSRSDRN
ncbi:MAG: amino acid ABC transporter permease [Oscillospiraceae bacterium]|nr:amino acid ABC transporter permease [Oscillospiraceae bacterium]MDD4367593.1 amino acid ABC transporter permease [Oscillospiraceae bacterium]